MSKRPLNLQQQQQQWMHSSKFEIWAAAAAAAELCAVQNWLLGRASTEYKLGLPNDSSPPASTVIFAWVSNTCGNSAIFTFACSTRYEWAEFWVIFENLFVLPECDKFPRNFPKLRQLAKQALFSHLNLNISSWWVQKQLSSRGVEFTLQRTPVTVDHRNLTPLLSIMKNCFCVFTTTVLFTYVEWNFKRFLHGQLQESNVINM